MNSPFCVGSRYIGLDKGRISFYALNVKFVGGYTNFLKRHCREAGIWADLSSKDKKTTQNLSY